MRYLIITFILFPFSLLADTTGNLLNQNFNTSAWSGTNKTSRHSNDTIAGVNDKYVESTISLSDTLTESQINNGWTSTLGADIWHWNNLNSTTTMKQTITNADGTITTQIREVDLTGCGSINCGGYATYTDSYTQGINSQSDYDIAVRFTFEESSNSSSHYGTDLKNPTLTIIHSLITTEQATTLSEISETVDEIIETEVETIEFEPLEEYTFEVFAEPEVVFEMLEEIYFVPTATEEINTGVIDIFFEEITIEPEEFTELIELPMEVGYGNQETIEAFSTEIEVVEESFETTEEITIEAEAPGVEVSGGNDEQIETNTNIAEEETSDIKGESETVIAEKSGGTESVSESEVSSVSSEESANEDVENVSESGGEEDQANAETNTDIDSRDDRTTEVSSVAEESIQVEDITREVERTIKNVDEQLVATQTLIAKVMSNNDILKGYDSVNQSIFDNQVEIYGGNLDEYIRRNYTDNRDIYSQVKIKSNLSLFHYQEQVQKAVDERIRAEEHLRSIRGY